MTNIDNEVAALRTMTGDAFEALVVGEPGFETILVRLHVHIETLVLGLITQAAYRPGITESKHMQSAMEIADGFLMSLHEEIVVNGENMKRAIEIYHGDIVCKK